MTRYEDLHGRLNVYQPYLEALSEVKKNRVNDLTRQLTASLTKDPTMQWFFMEGNSRPIDFKAPLKEKVTIEKESLEDYLSHNPINSILVDAPEQELDSLIQVVRPIDYTGANQDLFNRITGLRMARDNMEKAIKTRDNNAMKAYTSVFYESYLNDSANNVTDQEKRITRAVINASPNFVPEFYMKRFELTSNGLATELQGNKPGYLEAMMQNRDFIQFMVDYRALKQKEAEREDPYI